MTIYKNSRLYAHYAAEKKGVHRRNSLRHGHRAKNVLRIVSIAMTESRSTLPFMPSPVQDFYPQPHIRFHCGTSVRQSRRKTNKWKTRGQLRPQAPEGPKAKIEAQGKKPPETNIFSQNPKKKRRRNNLPISPLNCAQQANSSV